MALRGPLPTPKSRRTHRNPLILPWAAVLVLGRLGLSQKLPWFSARAAMFLGMLAIMLYRRDWYTGGYSVNQGHVAVELE